LSSRADRRKFLKYIGAGVVAATAAGAGYYFYGKPARPPSETITIPKGWETATTWLKKTSLAGTTATLPRGDWWKNAKVATASVDYWNPEGKQFVEDAGIEVIDWLGCGAMDFTPAMIWREGLDGLVDMAHSMGVMARSYENLMGTKREAGSYVLGADGHIYPPSAYGGESLGYPLKILYQSDYWFRYFDEKWRNPDGSTMEDPIEGGCARNLDNQIVDFPMWGFSLMSIHNPYYLEYVKKCLEIDVNIGFDGINLDNINCTAFGFWNGGDFSPWAEHKFKEYLSNTHSEKQLSTMGVRDLDEFNLREYLSNRGYFNNVHIDDPIVKIWSRFECVAFNEFLQAVCEHAKNYAKSRGRDWFAVSGNVYNLRGWPSPFTILGTNHFDIVWLEENGYWIPPGRISLVTKQGLAFSGSRKPVWQLVSSENPEAGKYLTGDYANLLGIIFAEVYSVGGLCLADRLRFVGFTAPTWLHPMGPKSTELITSYCRFIRKNERHFLDARPCRPPVAIAYSLPTMMMGFYPSLGLVRSWEWDRGIMGISHVLDREHIPFDFIVLGHPEFWDDTEVLSRLWDYEILVLSNAEAMTERQAQAIRSFVQNGGRLLSFGTIATRDENYNQRNTSALRDLARLGLNRFGDGKTLHLSTNPGYPYWTNVVEDRREDLSNFKTISDAVGSLISRPPIVETNAPDTVSISILWQADRSIQVHLVNLDYDEEDDSIAEKDNLRVKVKIPSGFSIKEKEGRLMTPDGNGSPQQLEYALLDGYVELEVPHLRIYSIATICDPKYFR